MGHNLVFLQSIRPKDPESLRNLLSLNKWLSGDAIVIPAPVSVAVCCLNAAVPFNKTIHFITNDTYNKRRCVEVKLGKLNYDSK